MLWLALPVQEVNQHISHGDTTRLQLPDGKKSLYVKENTSKKDLEVRVCTLPLKLQEPM